MSIERQESALQVIVHTLKDRSGRMNFHELERDLSRKGHTYYDASFLADRLQQLELAEYVPRQHIKLTQKGWDFTTFYDQRLTEHRNNEVEILNTENLQLQNESLKYQNSMNDKQSEIDNLTIENLKLQNRQIKRYVIYSIIAFVAGAILTNISSILNFIKSYF
ncbi:hypothetical protein N7U66_05035 [Lacinutrix neustonica]|uniref:Uncharacterized protein n=1 Tax=Lacinutrix neustonica TaxID=2980107 RepID=A0A9E8MX63_9FLAO|nr:hypothetical protein [Lacinutrix neustonica]WAC02996.1 hypothetical protein N7U66_05035 [Lacinutrix neustonica]